MEVSLKKGLVDLEGKAIPDSDIGKIVANELAASKTGDALKFWDWAQKLYAGKKLDLDPSDLALLKNFVNSVDLPVITKAQILAILK